MRIISGFHKGRRLRAPKKLPVRPTTDMAKEAIFNILENIYDFKNIVVLDLFSGTGNISYEFCSRGTTKIISIDRNYRCIKFIKETSKILKMPISAVATDVFLYLGNTKQTFDLIFADPPYETRQNVIEALVAVIFKRQLLKSGGMCIVEHSKQKSLSHLKNFDNLKTYGGNCFSFFK